MRRYALAVIIAACAIIIYTSIGGFLAVCWTDAVQGILMLGALIIVPFIAVIRAGGPSPSLAAIRNISPHLLNALTGKGGAPLTAIGLLSSLGWGLGYFGMPHIITRFMAIESEHKVAAARRIALTWTTLSLAAAICVGLSGIAVFGAEGLGDGEIVFIKLVERFLHPIPAGICLAAILAAIMSTADSQLLVCTSVITEDFYKTFFKRDASQKELVVVGRLSVVIIATVAAALALRENTRIMSLVSYAWAGFGAALGPVLLLSLYWKGMTRNGALAGIITGGLTVIIWKQLNGGIFELYEIVPGFALSAAAVLGVSTAGKKRKRTAEVKGWKKEL